ncbi:MAG: hypothetical protein HFI93_11175 [Lachnospiraceae bacterium]|nr:hypothetical protein [Lachnospiraceae bacterium]
MSRKKVEQYKEQKARRKEILEKEKKRKKMTKAAWIAGGFLVLGLICGAIGVTIRNQYREYQANLPNYTAASTMLVEDLAGVLTTEAAE